MRSIRRGVDDRAVGSTSQRPGARASGAAHVVSSSLALLAFGALFGCSFELPGPMPSADTAPDAERRGGIVTVASFADLRSLDPANVTDGLAPQVLEALYAGLVDYDEDGSIVGDLADHWTIEDDGRTFRFFLHQGVRFHDGTELTASDVKRSVERALAPPAPNASSSYFTSIVGYDALTSGKAEHLAGVTVEGPYVVTFHLEEKDATFLPVLALPYLRPVCKSGGARYEDGWHPCGTGPFKLPEGGWLPGRQIDVVRHEAYFRPGLPYLDGVRFLFRVSPTTQRFKFLRGEQDIVRDFLPPELPKFQADPRWRPFGHRDFDTMIVGEAMNTEMPPFDNVEVRRAVASAIDRQELRLVRAGSLTVADQPVPPAVLGHSTELRCQHYDYPAALEHMRRAGYPYDPETGKGGYPHEIPYIVYGPSLQELLAQVTAQQLAKIGLRISLHLVNYPTFLALRGRRGASAFGPGFWMQDYPEAGSFLEPLFHSKSIHDEDSNNWSFYKSPRLDALLDRAKRELDERRRKQLYVEAQELLCDDAPWAFTTYFHGYAQWQPYVRNYRPHPMWTHTFKRVWLDRQQGPARLSTGLFTSPTRSLPLERAARSTVRSALNDALRALTRVTSSAGAKVP